MPTSFNTATHTLMNSCDDESRMVVYPRKMFAHLHTGMEDTRATSRVDSATLLTANEVLPSLPQPQNFSNSRQRSSVSIGAFVGKSLLEQKVPSPSHSDLKGWDGSTDGSEASPPRHRPKPPQNPSLSPSRSKIAGDASADEMAKLRRASGASKLKRACNASCASGGSKADEEEISRQEGQRRSTDSSSTSSPESRRCMPHHTEMENLLPNDLPIQLSCRTTGLTIPVPPFPATTLPNQERPEVSSSGRKWDSLRSTNQRRPLVARRKWNPLPASHRRCQGIEPEKLD
eukprot:CAMPEP_0198222406 /NCGR_PEP_ID=MMETSP1445-20131203/87964_1 /TAXON_ID=36898 /ORGANISM="Pyramimonas sp., Strain CCMP2087" /LENGTH=287 /DNA_ID=CAMNT_0043900907 /DNA_START=326 /DNA_END=1186 /DNA_ORIENTATION=+